MVSSTSVSILDGSSTSVTQDSALLKLLAEIQNIIYGLLFEYLESVKVLYRDQILDPKRLAASEEEENDNSLKIEAKPTPRKSKFNLDTSFDVPVALLFMCRILRNEATSSFYANNTLELGPQFKILSFWSGSIAEALATFLNVVGSPASMIRRVDLDLTLLSEHTLYHAERGHHELNDRIFRGHEKVFEITPLLKTVWTHDYHLDLGFVRHELGDNPTISCNVAAMTQVLRSILQGQLRENAHGPLLCGVAMKRDGSGGAISWGRVAKGSEKTFSPCNRWFPEEHFEVEFSAEEGVQRLEMKKREDRRTLLCLPSEVRGWIFEEVVCPEEAICVDLDAETEFGLGLPHINKHLWRKFLFNKFSFKMATSQRVTTFEDFSALQTILRHIFSYPDDRGEPREVCLGMLGQDANVVLEFKASEAQYLEEIRINIVPLVMETSSFGGDEIITVRLYSSSRSEATDVIAENNVRLQDLRMAVVQALFPCTFQDQHSWMPEIWINGLGVVVETCVPKDTKPGADPEVASDVVYGDGGWYKILKLHPKDKYYRGKQGRRGECEYSDANQIFPFEQSSAEMLRYLLWVLEYNNPELYTREG